MKTKIYCAYILLAVAAQLLIGCSSGDIATLLGGGGKTGGTSKTLLVTDSINSRVILFNLPTSTDASATVVLGEPDFTTQSFVTTSTGMTVPVDATPDASGNIWVVDTDNNRVLEFKPPFSNGMAASVVIGQADFTSSGSGTSATTLEFPTGATFDSAGNLWVMENDNDRVMEFKPPFSNGMAASVVIGEPDFTTKACVVSSSGLCGPQEGLVFDSSGNLWVSDFGNCRILEYKAPLSTGMAASLAIGAIDTNHGGCGAPVSATSVSALGLAFDSSGNLWAADANSARVLEFKPPFSNDMAASVVLGQSNFTSNTTATTQSGMWGPTDVAFDSAGNLYVADPGNNRVVMYAPPFSSGMAGTLVLGQPDFTTQSGHPTSANTMFPAGVTTMR